MSVVFRRSPGGGEVPVFSCPPPSNCEGPIDVSGSADELTLTVYATGLAAVMNAGKVEVAAGFAIPVAAIRPHATRPGVSEVDVRIPGSFPLRGYIPLRITTSDRESQPLYLRFR